MASDAKPRSTQVCVQQDGATSDRCVEVDTVAMRLSGGLAYGELGVRAAELTVQFDVAMLARFAAVVGSGDEVELCIIEGANICPPEPFELVWVCITTGMLAGTECPHPPETDTAVATVRLRSGG